MTKRYRFALLSFAIAMALPLAAQADEAYITSQVSLRAGPAEEYPDIMYLPYGAEVDVQGCTDGWEWCDVIAEDADARGWVPGDYLEYNYDDQPVLLSDYGEQIGVPIVTFVIGDYWGRYYRNRPFYRQRSDWYHRDIRISAPPRAPRDWRARFSNGGPNRGPHGGPYHENPPNPPRAPVNPVHSGTPHGGWNHEYHPQRPNGPYHENPVNPPRAPVNPVHPTMGGPHPTMVEPHHPASASSHDEHPRDHKKPHDNNNDNGH